MPAISAADALSPAELVDTAMTRPLSSFVAVYGDTLLLLVRLVESEQELALGLRGEPAAAGGEPMQFHTVVQSREDTPARRPVSRLEDPGQVVQILRGGHHFALPLRKREESEGMSQARISVGRARNKDIVLRHGSVSKFHAWFETGPDGEVQLTDAGSRNQTRVNGVPIPAREARRLEPGDRIRFGSVECSVCSADTLYAALRAFENKAR